MASGQDRAVKYLVGSLLMVAGVIAIVGGSAAGQSAAGTIEVPFEYYKNELLVQTRVNGQGPFTMMVDTGTDPSAIDLATAKQIGLKLSPEGRPSSGGGTGVSIAFKCKFNELRLGNLTANGVTAAAIDLSRISERMGRHIDGVLGHSLLNRRIVQFDYPAKMLRFFDAFPAAKPRLTAASIPFKYDDGIMIDDAKVNGTPVKAIVDTGSSGLFALSPAAVEKLKLADEAKNSTVTRSAGYNGEFESREGKLSSVSVGTFAVDNGKVRYFPPGTGHDKTNWDLNIGNEFFATFVLTIDYRRKLLRLEK